MRTIRESEIYTRQCGELGMGSKRLDEVLRGITYLAAKRPEVFPEIEGTGLRIAVTDPFADAPAIRVYFRVTDSDYLDFERIEFVPDPDDPVY